MSESQNEIPKEIRLRMIPVLEGAKDKLGSFDKLAQEIFRACQASEHPAPNELKPIDRRKLKSLIEGEDVALRISELLALNEFLRPLGEGLSTKPLIQESAILPSLSRSERVTMLLGSYPRDEDRRNIYTQGGHDHSRHNLVAVGNADHPVKLVSLDHCLNTVGD